MRGLAIKESLGRMQERIGEMLDRVAANTAQMTMNEEKNMNIVARLHDVITYCRVFMIVTIVFIVLMLLLVIAYWVQDRRKSRSDTFYIVVQGMTGQ
ncbi:uncharacterized protein LAESUDRAFT_458468 [Laetiporus sulphureus 93-53]|uniref:Uncharacterized protein n=1 Tax=Laetiporus sulphureus 93-53 TaxID=1314785 RepID=A0A165BRE8_9APHY|nr:uncharacterized protein LAESUDRAFT_458468 [Laetiporus sulphureus 93-53]KZT01515.1 hypothetical protein LAESUDRAFT_458468 [Laetiporus sulphureus 93-53]